MYTECKETRVCSAITPGQAPFDSREQVDLEHTTVSEVSSLPARWCIVRLVNLPIPQSRGVNKDLLND
jgi:hypothetical protein